LNLPEFHLNQDLFSNADDNAVFSRVNFEKAFTGEFPIHRPAEVSPSAAGRALVGRAERDHPAEQLRANPGYGVWRLSRRHHVEPKYAIERGLPVCERGGAAAQA